MALSDIMGLGKPLRSNVLWGYRILKRVKLPLMEYP